MDQFGESLWVAVGAILVTGLGGALAALLIWGGRRLWLVAFGEKPDFVLRKHGGRWELERTRSRTAYAVVAGQGVIGGGGAGATANIDFDAKHRYGDIRFHDRLPTNFEDSAEYVWFCWIDGERRIARSVDLRERTTFELHGLKVPKSGSFRT